MTDLTAVTAASTSLSLLFLWFLFQWFWRDYRVDRFRQRIFALRDELFDLARQGAISFDHPAYGLLRTALNGFIRFAHRIRPFALFWITYGMRRDEVLRAQTESFVKQWSQATAELDYETVKRLNGILERAHSEVAAQFVLTSMALVFSIVPLILLVLFDVLRRTLSRYIATPIKRLWHDAVDQVDTTALAVGAG